VKPSVELADSVELWARQRGTHAKLHWHPLLRCFAIDLDLANDDPRMKKWRSGELRRKPVESIPLHAWDKVQQRYVALPIEEWGPTALVERLTEADLLSGRGQYNTIYEALVARQKKNDALRERMQQEAYDVGRDVGSLGYRTMKGLPLVSVAADIQEENND
jgi:hypothetical protein